MPANQLIKFFRRVTGVGVPTTLEEGEPFYNSLGQELYIGDASKVPQVLVSGTRQVEVSTDQTITGNKTIAVTHMHITGGTAGQVLSTTNGGTGAMAFITPASGGSGGITIVATDGVSVMGDGVGTPLSVGTVDGGVF